MSSLDERIVQRVASCIFVTAGDTHPERAERAARELISRGWIDTNAINPDTRESSAGRVSL